jgi:Fe-S oxidoreductase
MFRELDKIEDDLYTCFQCGYCKSICPMSEQIGWESASPRGKIFYLKQLSKRSLLDKILRRNKKVSNEFIKRMYQCTGCGACEEVCHVNLNLHDLWADVREWLVANNEELPEMITKMRSTIETNHSPYVTGFDSEAPTDRNKMLLEKFKLPKQANIVFFVGCVSSSLLIKMMNSAIKILRKSETNFTVLEDEWCCGNILGTTGQGKTDTFRTHAEHNLAAVSATGAQTLITACPGCYRTFTEMYPKYITKPNFQVLHFTEFLSDLVDNDKISFKKSLDKTIAYHDPCELGRLSGIFEPPRKILDNIPGLQLEELTDNKANCNCCGNGGGINSLEPEIAMNLSLKKIDEVLDTSAELLVSSCPNCRYGLGNAIVEQKQRLAGNGGGELNLEMKDITELVSKLV